ncbi:variant erythrocyte surface antigen-1 family protein, partial [Babesia divergens]
MLSLMVQDVDLKELTDLASGLKSFIGYGSNGSLTGTGIGKTGQGGSQYASSYSNASWEELCENCKCKSNPSSHSHSCSCGSSSGSCHGSCCENCNVKKAAKIFLGFIPCLYYALDYLYDKCKVDWSSHNINQKDLSLHRFLVGMGYDVGKLHSKKGEDIFTLLESLFPSNGPLEKLYEKCKNYFPSPSPSPSHVPSSDSKPKTPSTVREILLWLSGLPFTSGFKALLEHCERLCKPVSSLNFDNFESSLYASCLRSPFVLAAIQWPSKSEIFPSDSFINSESLYPEDAFDLLETLFKYIHKIYTPLTFLEYQCRIDRDQAGWKNCGFGQKCMDALKPFLSSAASSPCCPTSSPHGILCTGKPGDKDHAEHCVKPGVKCMGLEECNNPSGNDAHQSGKCDPCPHPLVRFLTDSWPFLRNSPDSFVPKMGFSKDSLPFPGRRGEALHTALKDFCDSGNSSSSLTTLLKFELHVSRTPPETLGELFGFFLQFQNSNVFISKPLKNLFDSYIKEEPGFYSADPLKTALQKLDASSSHTKGDHSGDSPAYDLRSLIDCHVPKAAGEDVTCGPYLNSLTGDVYTNFIDNFDETYLSWICYLPKDFKDRLEKLKKDFASSCSDCYTPGSSSSSSCTTIVNCPCAWPLISSQGFSFTSRGSLSGETSNKEARKCSDFIKQLEKVLQDPQSTLLSLIAEIEKFLWSIRLPFFLFILAFWAFVISYFLYVQLYKLDLLHLKSHAHLPRSFKILPSTLFSDASS